jgi:hypothetical protein
VQGNDLVTEDVVARSDVAGDGDGPGVVTSDQLIGCPGTWNSGVVEDTNTIDLEEFQGCIINSLAVTAAVCEVV